MFAALAQLVEHVFRKDDVRGSIPRGGSMKKRVSKKSLDDDAVVAELDALFSELDQLEYRSFLYDQELTREKANYLELALRAERTVLGEQERKEVEAEIADVHGTIETLERKLADLRDRLPGQRKRLEKVRVVHEAQRAKKKRVTAKV